MKKLYFLFSLILLGLLGTCMTGCGSGKSTLNPEYLNQYDTAIDQMAQKTYDQAETTFLSLMDEIDQDSSSQTDSYIEFKADIEYALGQICLKRCDYQKAYDYYMSAYTYYGNVLGAKADKTFDTRLQLATIEQSYLARKEHALTEYMSIYESADESRYKDYALCFATSLYISMDNGSATEQYIGKVKDLADSVPLNNSSRLKSLVGDKGSEKETKQERIVGRIMGEDPYLAAYNTLATYYYENEDPDEAIKMYESSLALLDKAGIEDEIDLIDIYDNLGFIYLYFKGEAEANEYLNKELEIIDQIYPRSIEKAQSYINIAEMYLSMGDYDQFGFYLEEAEDMVRETAGENHRLMASSKVLLSQYYRMIGEFQKAIQSAKDAIEIKKNILEEDSDSIGSFYNNLANCYADGGNKADSIDAYLKSIEIYRGFGDDLQVAVAERNIALIYNNTYHEHSLALSYARDAVSLVENMDESYYGGTIAAIYMVMADILVSSDYDYDRVEEYSEKAYQRLQNAVGNVDEAIGNYHYNLGMYLSDNSRYTEALAHLLAAEELFETVYKEVKFYPVDILHDIAYCYYRTGFYDNALTYYQNSVDYNRMHIALLNESGNYRTSYWENMWDDSYSYIKTIESLQKDEPPLLFGGRYLDERNEELSFRNEYEDGTIDFVVTLAESPEVFYYTGTRNGNQILFEQKNGDEKVVSGSIQLEKDKAVLTIDDSKLSYIKTGTREYTFYDEEALAERTLKKLLVNTESKGWVKDYLETWQSKIYLYFSEDTLTMWIEDEDGEFVRQQKPLRMLSENRILIGDVEYSIYCYGDMVNISPLHSDELQLKGNYYFMKEDDGIFGGLR